MSQQIKLNGKAGYGKFVLVSDEDYNNVKNIKWYLSGNKKYAYGIVTINGTTKPMYIHRFIMSPNKDKFIDHINGDGLNCTRENMRACTNQENQRNRKVKSGKFKGIYFDKKSNEWIARVKMNGKNVYIGNFDKEELAAKAYDYYALKYFGQFARLNFPNFDYTNYRPAERAFSKHSEFKYKGVSYDNKRRKWFIDVYHNNKHYKLGQTNNPIKAAEIYDAFIVKNGFNKELNFPKKDYSNYQLPERQYHSKYIGVTAQNGKWRVSVILNGVKTHVGYYADEDEAALAYNNFILEHNLNREINHIVA